MILYVHGYFINNKNDLKNFLKYESNLYDRKNIKCPIILIRENDILWKHNYLLRKTEYYNNVNKKILKNFYKLRLRLLQNKYQIFIPLNVFDKGLKLIHLGQRLVNGKTKVGKNCVMHVNTYIVAGGTEKGGFPILGNNVILGIGSVVLGNVKIGDYTAIGANAVVNKSFEEGNITIAGVPAKKISNNSRKDWNKK